ncbi:MAG: PASTA domain-containing protein, partial [Planctomycetota bacterium]
DGFTITAGNANGSYPHDSGSGMYNNSCSPTVTNCTFTGNSADYGGGMYNRRHLDFEPIRVTNCTFTCNSASWRGGGMYNSVSSLRVKNCTFTGNSVRFYGGGMCNRHSSPKVINCTFGGNSAYNGGAMFNYSESRPTVTNCILWGNTETNDEEIYNNSSTPLISYSDIAGSGGSGLGWDTSLGSDGGGNIDADPLFVRNPDDGADGWGDDPYTPSIDEGANDDFGDLRLRTSSPCIDAGDNSVIDPGSTDLDGNPRIIDGYYEFVVIYVDADNTAGGNNGSSWEDAFTSLQDALEAALFGDQIWVIEGTYYPTSDYGLGIGDRGRHFRMRNSVAIYGGFPSGGGVWADRDPTVHETILSGDLNGDDDSGGDNSDNCYHVFYHPDSTNLNDTAILDGFIITAGNADGSYPHDNGGGMSNVESSPIVISCIFSSNSASWRGGGMCNDYSSPTVTGCTLTGNSAGGGGGGMFNDYSNPTVTNCTFSSNSAGGGGGMANDWGSDSIVTGCTFSGNSATDHGGGMSNVESSPIVTNCILWGNTASNGNEIALGYFSTIYVDYCDVRGGLVGIYDDGSDNTINWGSGNIDAGPLFVRNPDDGADGWGDDPCTPSIDEGANDDFGNLQLSAGSPCIDAGDSNSVPADITNDLDGYPRIIDGNCDQTQVVDIGAHEFNYRYLGDFDSQCDVDLEDFGIFAMAWQTQPADVDWNPVCDISEPADDLVDMADARVLGENWLTFALYTPPGPVTVPDVVGMLQATAEAAITAASLVVDNVTTSYDPNIPVGSVISQDPNAGSSVLPDTFVDLVVSLGPEPVTVPDVVGMLQATAEATITAASLVVDNVTTSYDPVIATGNVISQNPVAGSSVLPGTSVDLVVSLGPQPDFAHWTMDDDAGNTTVLDSSVNGIHGTAQQNTEYMSTIGIIDDALDFDGTSDYVDLGTSTVIKPSSQLSLACWLYVDELSVAGVINNKIDGQNSGYRLL